MKMRSRKIILTILPLLTISPLFAAESAYVQNQRFMPLPPTINSRPQHPLIIQPAKFFPLTQTRYPLPIRNETKNNLITKEDTLPPAPTKITSNSKSSMSHEQAQQILSIFVDNE